MSSSQTNSCNLFTEYPVNETATITLIDGPYPDCVSY